MGWLKDLFIKKEPIKVEPVIEPQVESPKQEAPRKRIEECFDCKQPIESWQKIRHWGGESYHKDCLRKLIKKARQYINQ